jgi:hypothetical protein
MSTGKIIALSILGLLTCVLLGFAVNAYDYGSFAFWAPKYENIKRKTFEQTQSYVEGKRQDLAKYHHEWTITTDPADKKAIEALVRQQFANVKPAVIEDPMLSDWLTLIMTN